MSGFLVGSPLIDPAVKRHNGGTSSLTLDNAGTTNSTLLFISGVAQTAGTDFTVSGTTLSTTTAIAAGTNIATTVQLAVTGTVNVPADNSVTVAKLAGGVLADGYAATDFDLGTNTTGTETLAYTNGNFQKGVNGGAHTLAPQGTTSTIIVQYTNDGSAGSVTTSGYTIVTGDSLTTTSGHDFMMYSTVLNSFKHLHVVALQ